MRHVMLWGLSGDPPLDAVRHELVRRRAPYVFIDQRAIGRARFELELRDTLTGRVTVGDERVDIDAIGSVFVRPYELSLIIAEWPGTAPDAIGRYSAFHLESRLYAWTEIADAVVVNRPSATSSNGSKPYQAELIRCNGFEIPATLVTTTPGDVRAFVAAHQDVIYKSVSDNRSMVTRVDAAALEVLEDVANCPTQFQERIEGIDWRVHVVGDDVFACEIVSDADDYRCAAFEGMSVDIRGSELPPAIASRCHALAHGLRLPLAGIDLRHTEDDAWYCFEVNPSPAFTFYEEAAGQPLTAAVGRLLCETTCGSVVA